MAAIQPASFFDAPTVGHLSCESITASLCRESFEYVPSCGRARQPCLTNPVSAYAVISGAQQRVCPENFRRHPHVQR